MLAYALPAALQLISLPAVQAEVQLVRSKAAGGTFTAEDSTAAPPACEAAVGSPHVAALLEWAQAVCAHYGSVVSGFGDCFGDGSVFCLLVRAHCCLLGHAMKAEATLALPVGWHGLAICVCFSNSRTCASAAPPPNVSPLLMHYLDGPAPSQQVHYYLGHAYVPLKEVYRQQTAAATAGSGLPGDSSCGGEHKNDCASRRCLLGVCLLGAEAGAYVQIAWLGCKNGGILLTCVLRTSLVVPSLPGLYACRLGRAADPCPCARHQAQL